MRYYVSNLFRFRLYDLGASWPSLSYIPPKAPGLYLPERGSHVPPASLECPDSPDRRAGLEAVQLFDQK